jgi:hypothetical protein
MIRLSCSLAGVLGLAACITSPPPVVIHEDPLLTVWVKFDARATVGHAHPHQISTENMTKVLSGVRVRPRNTMTGFSPPADADAAAAFTASEVVRLAPHLSKALAQASPKDIATFYLTMVEPGLGKLVTSGGVFVQGQRLYLILANHRSSPSTGQYETTYELDPKDDPLLPIARYKFTVAFNPRDAWIPNKTLKGSDAYSYVDESKLVVIDLSGLFGGNQTAPSVSAP